MQIDQIKDYLYIHRDYESSPSVIRFGVYVSAFGSPRIGLGEHQNHQFPSTSSIIGFDITIANRDSHFNYMRANSHNLKILPFWKTLRPMGFTSNVHQIQGKHGNSLTQLPLRLIEAMQTPIPLPLLPSLSNNTPQEQTGRSIRNFKNLEENQFWVDTRGTISHIGTKYKKLIANAGPRMALTAPGYHRSVRNNEPPVYNLKLVSGATAAKPGNYFLYSQPLRAYNVYTKQWFDTTWIGLASCMNFTKALKNYFLYNLSREIKENSFLDKVIRTRQSGSRSPFQRLANNHQTNISFNKEEWEKWKARTLEDYATGPNPTLLKEINYQEYLKYTPLSLLIKRLEQKQLEKTNELNTLENNLRNQTSELERAQTDIILRYAEIARHQAEIQQNEQTIPILERKITALTPKVNSHRTILKRIMIATEKKTTEYEKIKLQCLKQFEADPNKLDYAKGLFESGIVIDELWYRHCDSNTTKKLASEDPKITVNSEWTLCRADMHTTKPIPIIFGLAEHGLPPRVSGPHKITATLRTDKSIRIKISALVPWSCCGFSSSGFKPFPHTPWRLLQKTENPASFTRKLQEPVTVCLGELGPNAAAAFRNNNPKQLALALLSYLQSTDPKDAYGESFRHFPLLSELIETESIGKYHKYKQKSIDQKKKYFINAENTKYFELSLTDNLTGVRWGDLQHSGDNQYQEISSYYSQDNTRLSPDHYHNPADYRISRNWTGGPYRNLCFANILPALPTCPTPKWCPYLTSPWTADSEITA